MWVDVAVYPLAVLHSKQAMIRSGTLSTPKKVLHRRRKGGLSGGRGRLPTAAAAADEVDAAGRERGESIFELAAM